MVNICVQDIALFLPTMVGSPDGSSGGPVFLAFHVNCPNRYLSEESINNAREALGASPAYILGRIILVEQHVASEVSWVCRGRGGRGGVLKQTHVILQSLDG